MDELDRRATRDSFVSGGTARTVNRVRRAQAQRRPQPFPAGLEQMAGRLTQKSVVGGHSVAQADLDPFQVLGQRCESHLVEEVVGHGGLASASRGALGRSPHGRSQARATPVRTSTRHLAGLVSRPRSAW